MRKTYEERGMKFAKFLAKLFQDCVYLRDFEYVLTKYNYTHSRKLQWAHGVSRIAIMRADYVIKFDFQPVGRWANGQAGDCYSEEEVYDMAVADGMEYLFAKTTVNAEYGKTFSIMPRINGVNDYNKNWWNYCTHDECEWLEEHVHDLHDGNVGYRHGKVCVIDYAWGV